MAIAKIYFSVLLVVMVASGVSTFDLGQTIKDGVNSAADGINKVVDVVGNSACILSHGTEFDRCNAQMEEYLKKGKIEQHEMKDYCCAYVEYRDCVEGVARQYCGDKAAEAIEITLNTIKSRILSDDCESYNNFFDCMDRTLFVVLIIVAVLILLFLVSCLFCLIRKCFC